MDRRITALIPCHNEQDLLPRAVRSLASQGCRPDRIVVVADNCTDGTVEVAHACGAEVWETVGNRHKKAGALNQALGKLLPSMADGDAVLVLDGDSVLVEDFVERALGGLRGGVGAVGGVFRAARVSNLVERLQDAEYVRYAREIARGKAKARVVTGTGALFSVGALRAVAEGRSSGRLPGGACGVYDVAALTEDNELTLALKHLGWRCLSPKGCAVLTEAMPSWGRLWRQRVRWQRGALENLRAYGLTRVTAPYVARQALMGAGVVAMALLLLTTSLAVASGGLEFQPLWLALTGVFAAERVTTAWRAGPVAAAIAAVLFVEVAYELLQQAVYVRCLFDAALRRDERWGTHVFAGEDGAKGPGEGLGQAR